MTSTMKSEPAAPPIRLSSFGGVPVSAAMVRAVGGSADGMRAVAAPAVDAALAGLRRHRAGGAGDRHAGQEFAAIDLRALESLRAIERSPSI